MNICMNIRAQRAKAALAKYCRIKGEPLDCPETAIIDLMADLLHLARREGLDGVTISRTAQVHFLLEFETETHRAYHKSNTTTKGE